jgi:hypothetical protein
MRGRRVGARRWLALQVEWRCLSKVHVMPVLSWFGVLACPGGMEVMPARLAFPPPTPQSMPRRRHPAPWRHGVPRRHEGLPLSHCPTPPGRARVRRMCAGWRPIRALAQSAARPNGPPPLRGAGPSRTRVQVFLRVSRPCLAEGKAGDAARRFVLSRTARFSLRPVCGVPQPQPPSSVRFAAIRRSAAQFAHLTAVSSVATRARLPAYGAVRRPEATQCRFRSEACGRELRRPVKK